MNAKPRVIILRLRSAPDSARHWRGNAAAYAELAPSSDAVYFADESFTAPEFFAAAHWAGTQPEYDALPEKDADTIYFIDPSFAGLGFNPAHWAGTEGEYAALPEKDANTIYFVFALSAEIADVTVSGYAGKAISVTKFEISVAGDAFNALAAGTDVSSWFPNLPAGLEAAAALTEDGAAFMQGSFRGTPTETLSAPIRTALPASALKGGFGVGAPENPNAVFDIKELPPRFPIPDTHYYIGYYLVEVDFSELGAVPADNANSLTLVIQSNVDTQHLSIRAEITEGISNISIFAYDSSSVRNRILTLPRISGGDTAFAPSFETPFFRWDADTKILTVTGAFLITSSSVYTSGSLGEYIVKAEGTASVEPPESGAEFVSLTANGSADAATSALFLTFDKEISALSAENISVTFPGGAIQTGALTALGGGQYTLSVSGIAENATATASVSKSGFVFTPAERQVFVYGAPASQKSATIGDVVVAGSSWLPITPVTARLSVAGDAFNALAAGSDVSAWFPNLPQGLSAAAALTADGAAFMEAEISGTPAGGASGPVQAEIPGSALHGGAALSVEINPNAVYQIGVPAALATIGDVVVAGTAWEAISPAAARFAVSGDKFRAITSGKDLSLWFQNLPAGLIAKAAGTADKSEYAEAVLEGTPATSALGAIQAQIPAAALYGDTAVQVAPNGNAIFAINPAPFSWELKKEITDQDYETLTQGDDRVALRCIAKAEIWVKGKVLSTGHEYNTSDPVIRELVLKRGVYELFVFNSYEERAEEKYRDLIELIESYFGDVESKIPDGGGTDNEPWIGPAVGATAPPKDTGIRYGR